jgi:predicted exporter
MSIMVANLSTVIGFGVLSFSSIPVLNGIGMTVGIGAVLSLIFAFAFFSSEKGDSGAQNDAN